MSLVWFRSTRNAKASRRTTSLIIAHIERYALPSRLPCLSLSLSPLPSIVPMHQQHSPLFFPAQLSHQSLSFSPDALALRMLPRRI